MRWRLSAFTWNDTTTKREIRAAMSRSLQLNLDAPSTLTFSIPGDHEQATLIRELVTDVMVNLNGTDLVRMRAWNGVDNCQETGYSVSYNFNDYRAVLARRKLRATMFALNYSGVDQATVALGIINAVEGYTNGDYGITAGVGATTGVPIDFAVKEGQWAAKEIDTMAKKSNGFDWDIGPDMKLNIYYPSRGASNGASIEYGKSISTFSRSKNPSNFANDVAGTGDTSLGVVQVQSATITTDPEGRWDAVVSFPDISVAATLTARTNGALDDLKTQPTAYNVELAPGFWKGPSHIGLGDTVRVKVKRGRINDDLNMRVYGIGISIDDDGRYDVTTEAGETVRLTLK